MNVEYPVYFQVKDKDNIYEIQTKLPDIAAVSKGIAKTVIDYFFL